MRSNKMKNNLFLIGKSTKSGRLEIDILNDKVYLNEQEIYLTNTEFKMVKVMLIENRVVSRKEFLRRCFYSVNVTPQTVDVHIVRIRKALGNKIIETIHNEGYEIRNGGES
jgi:two-component system phosphate regulon response regulator PhoB